MTKYYCPSCNSELELDYKDTVNKIVLNKVTLAVDNCNKTYRCDFDYWYNADCKIVKADYRLTKGNLSLWTKLDVDAKNVIVTFYDTDNDTGRQHSMLYDGEYGIGDLNGLMERTLKLMVLK